jgi:predicted TIM-barrel fold metal-dependent hydrolase
MPHPGRVIFSGALVLAFGIGRGTRVVAQSPVDSALAAFIAGIRAVDNHTHVNSVVAADSDSDALPLDGLPAFPFPFRLRPENPEWLAAYKAIYGYQYDDLSGPHFDELRATMRRIAREQGERFPTWVLDKLGIEVMLANRIAMGPGLAPPRFRWVSYADALLFPLSTMGERAASPDYQVLYPLEEKLLRRYLADLSLKTVPATLDDYHRAVVTPTLERQRKDGCLAVKFEAAYLRALDFGPATRAAAARVYARYAAPGATAPPHGEYKTLQDFLFRYIAREAGRLGMAVHIHVFEGAGSYYHAAGSDPLLLEPAITDPSLRKTTFVIVHGGGIFAPHTAALFWKPNVYADVSGMVLAYPPATLAQTIRPWLEQFPERVLFGSDAFAGGPDAGWELAGWLGTTSARRALAIALTGMMGDGEVTRERAQEIATMVMRTNAGGLYRLELR